ncbi:MULTISPECIES: DUF4307 domain-containing protein [unclassified Diaminobutyricimonas]|uniref:DUF4307 domain-containing protein n=1 Tax=unclassified Diaminobutyricimonas TaxID=2643261 RepID=UPI0012F50EBC|nr:MULTISPECIES: DUF4307 domain-containing protein [unclassified Diaminobutyricimonas]
MADESTTTLDERYGRTSSKTRRDRVWLIAGGSAVAVVVLAWVVWASLLTPAASIEARDTGYSAVTDHGITVEWRLTVEPGSATKCAVQALNDGFSVVGWKIVDVPASDQPTRVLSESIRTTERPNTGLIYRCWLA